MGILKWLGLRRKSPKAKPPKPRRPKQEPNAYPPLPAQDPLEFQAFLDLLRAEGVNRYLEIGSRHGGSFNAVMRSLPAGSVGIAIDLPGVSWGIADSELSLRRVVADLCRDGYRAEAIFGSSRDPAIVEAAASRAPFDAALIDGDHSYDGAMADWLNYGSLARVVAFHDVAGDNLVTKRTPEPVEVPRVWRDVKANAKGIVHEFVTDPNRYGIGVIVQAL